MRRLALLVVLMAGGLRAQSFIVSPGGLEFGNVPVGCSVSLTFTVTPSAALTFTLTTTNGPFSLASASRFTADTAQTVTVLFKPTLAGRFQGHAVDIVARDAQDREVQTSAVILGGVGVDIGVTPNPIDFGLVQVGATSAPQTVRLTTNPAVTFNFQVSAASSNTAFRSSTVSATGEAQITFTPPSTGQILGTITFTVTRPGASACPVVQTISVRGTGVAVEVTVNPTSIAFGAVAVGTTSPAKTATLTNNSNIDLTGTATSSNPAFGLSPASFTVAAGRSQSFDLNFKPSATGAQAGAVTFTLVSGGSGGFRTTLTLRLSGQGQAPADLSVSPETVDFGEVGVGSSAVRSVRISNPGGVKAEVTASTSAPFSVSTTSFPLEAAGFQLVNIGFAPSRDGSFQETATFTAGGVARAVALTGRGVAPSLSFSFAAGLGSTPVAPGGTIPLPPTTVGTTNSVQFQINNTGTVPAVVSSIGITGTIFGLGGVPSLPAPVAPGGSLIFTVRFRPDAPGSTEAALGIDGRSFNLSGVGLLPAATITGTGVTAPPAQQRNVGVTIPQSYRVAVSGRLVLAFSPNTTGGDDPAIQFASGGRSVSFTIPVNSTVATFVGAPQIGFQTGTVTGTIEFRAVFDVGGTDVSPSPNPTGSVTVARSAPFINSFTASRTTNGLQAVTVGFSTTREVSGVDVQFTPAPGANLATTRLSLDVATLFKTWYESAAAAPFGSLFTLTIPFTVQGDVNAVRSLSVTLSNGDGNSQTMEATLSP